MKGPAAFWPAAVLASIASIAALLLSGVASPLVEGTGSRLLGCGLLAGMGGLSLLWATPRVRGLKWFLVALTIGLLAALWVLEDWSQDGRPALLQSRFEQALHLLRLQADEVAERLTEAHTQDDRDAGGAVGDSTDLDLFRLASEAIAASTGPADSLFIVDVDGVAEAWAGSGLRHTLPESDLPQSGSFSLSSFTATTLGHVAVIRGDPQGRRVVVGASYSSLRLPVFLESPWWALETDRNGRTRGHGRVWSAAASGPTSAVSTGDLELVVQPSALVGRPPGLVAIGVLVLLLVLVVDVVAGQIAAGSVPPTKLVARVVFFAAVSATVAGLLDLLAFKVALGLLLLVVVAGVASALAYRSPPVALRVGGAVGLLGATACLVTWLGSDLLREGAGLELNGLVLRLSVEPAVLIAGLLSALAAVAVLVCWSGEYERVQVPSRPLIASAAGLLLLAHAPIPQVPALAAGCLAGGLLVAVSWKRELRSQVTLGVAGLLIAASFWTVVSNETAVRQLGAAADPTLSSFSSHGRQMQRDQVAVFFESLDIHRLTLGLEPARSHADDLSLLLWMASPLSQTSGPSALRLTQAGASQFFGVGLKEQESGEVTSHAANPERLRRWSQSAMVSGSVDSGAGWLVEFFVMPTPQFGGEEQVTESDLARRFLLGESFSSAQWSTDLAMVAGPWEGEAGIVLGDSQRIRELEDSNGRSPANVDGGAADPVVFREQWFEESLTLVRTYLPQRPWFESLLRTAIQVSAHLVLAAVVLALLALVLVGAARRESQFLGSFSRRLVLAFALLASIPIVLLSVLLLRSFSDRLQFDQQLDGEAALSSAERMVGDYLSSLEPGFSVTTVLDDELLSWISLIVGHEVNLYWRGSVLTSSRPELFSSGLLPSQIPGEVFSALALEGREVAARMNDSKSSNRYLELYQQVDLPNSGRSGLFVSVPLLAQQIETTFTLRRLLNQALVLATVLTLLLIAVAVRFAEGLTKPITAIVAGTQRIAAGEEALGLTPRIPELRILADAIDDMAGKIASGRERLVREKQVVDTVIANIKSAVVSFGENERVIMTNREAADLLGVRPGDSLEQLTGRIESEELAKAVGSRPAIAERTSIRVDRAGRGAEEWTVQWLPIAGIGDPAALLVVEDVTEVLRAQRLAAWAEMARIIAHEVKNPLTPITLSADHLRRVYQSTPERLDDVFERCIDNILAQVDELRLIAEEFSTYSRIPTSNKTRGDLGSTVREVVNSYRSGTSDDLVFSAQISEQEFNCEHDRRLIGRVLRNLYENAIRACEGVGRVHLDMHVEAALGVAGKTAKAEDRVVALSVRDSGPGVAPSDLHRIFEPTFSASTGGTGLGLPIAKSIIEDHGGTITAANSRSSALDPSAQQDQELAGLVVSIRLPFDA